MAGCVYDRAPVPVERTIRTEEDLSLPAVSQLRPHHIQPYVRLEHTPEGVIRGQTWEEMTRFTWSFFGRCSMDIDNTLKPEDADDHWRDLTPSGSNLGSVVGEDYRETLKTLMQSAEPCVVLLCSPPGAGKSHFASELAAGVKSEHGYQQAFIDGSDDRLVDLALRAILDLELPDSSKFLFLIVDEFHMLNEHHKRDLFEWLQVRARRLQVLLIANRKDSRDEELMDTLRNQTSGIQRPEERVRLITTRLNSTLLNEVMAKIATAHRDHIRRWMHCARSLFGGEAVSLRNIPDLDKILSAILARTGSHLRLVDLLLNKVPIISSATAEDFVVSFLASFKNSGKADYDPIDEVQRACKGPVSVMFQAALGTEQNDTVGMDFPDFVSFGLQRAYDAPPALRIAAWCCHMRAVAARTSPRGHLPPSRASMDVAASIFHPVLVDQCGFPLQLQDQGHGQLCKGLAFSWGGDYTRMREIIDAVKHGHSVDWTDVHERCWKFEPVQDSSMLVELLSVCASPGKVLDALTKENLCSLLKKSPPTDSLSIAQSVVRNETNKATVDKDAYMSPYRTAIWMMILYDADLEAPQDLIDRIDGSSEARESVMSDLVDTLKWASSCMQDMNVCQSKIDPKARTRLVLDILLFLSRCLLECGDHARVPHLWHGMFAPLLHADHLSHRQGENNDDILVSVAIYSQDKSHKWPQPVPVLWEIAHGKGTAGQVADLWGDSGTAAEGRYRRLLFIRDGPGEIVADSPIHPKLAAGILSVSGSVLPYDVQEALLTRGGDVDLDCMGGVPTDATRLVTTAIGNLVKAGEDTINLTDGPFKRLVMKVAEQFKEEEI